jgi:hypothetical protein
MSTLAPLSVIDTEQVAKPVTDGSVTTYPSAENSSTASSTAASESSFHIFVKTLTGKTISLPKTAKHISTQRTWLYNNLCDYCKCYGKSLLR